MVGKKEVIYLSEIFKDCRVCGLAGGKNTGKTNNLIFLIEQYKQTIGKDTDIYLYGFSETIINYLKKKYKNISVVSSLRQISNKKDGLIIMDEFQKLKLNDRRYKGIVNDFISFIYHNNNYLILCSPSVREFNNIIGVYVEKWILKTINIHDCVNGSQLKKVVDDYKGNYKQINQINMEHNKLLLIDFDEEKVFICGYIKDIDDKKKLKKLF